jgi:hypothetical protein
MLRAAAAVCAAGAVRAIAARIRCCSLRVLFAAVAALRVLFAAGAALRVLFAAGAALRVLFSSAAARIRCCSPRVRDASGASRIGREPHPVRRVAHSNPVSAKLTT